MSEESESLKEESLSNRKLSRSLRGRARWLKFQSYLVLMLIIATMAGGAYLFYFAAQISGRTFTALASELQDRLRLIDSKLADVQTKRDKIAIDINQISKQNKLLFDEFSISEIQMKVISTQLNDDIFTLNKKIDSLDGLDANLVTGILEKYRAQTEEAAINAADTLVELFDESNCEIIHVSPGAKDAYTRLDCKSADINTMTVSRNIDSEIKAISFYFGTAIADISKLSETDITLERSYDKPLRDMEISFGKSNEYLSQMIKSFESVPILEIQQEADIIDILQPVRAVSALSDRLMEISSGFSSTTENWSEFARETTVRVTVVILIIFLVQILVNLFRYGTRLAAFYEARADAIDYVSINATNLSPSDFQQMVASLSPDTVDFGKAPRSPIDSAVELSRQIVTARKGIE